METCRAAVITEHNKPLTIERVPIPKLDPGSLLVKIAASTLCGTDVHRWHGPLPAEDSLPIITGHEPCGYVEEIAGDRTDILGSPVKRGDRIVWSYVACGSCYYCAVALHGVITAAINTRIFSVAAPSICTCRKNVSSLEFPKKLLPHRRRRPRARTVR